MLLVAGFGITNDIQLNQANRVPTKTILNAFKSKTWIKQLNSLLL